MNVLQRVAQGVSRRFSSMPGGDPWAIPSNGSLGGWSAGGVSVTQQTAMQLAAVYGCVRLISGVLSGLPMLAIDERDGKPVGSGQTPPVLRDPFGGENTTRWPMMARRRGMSMLAVSELLRGNQFLNIVRTDIDHRPELLQVLAPDQVGVSFDATNAAALTYKVNGVEVDPDTIIHGRGLSMPGDPLGMSPIEYARRTIALGISAETFGERFFSNGAQLGGIIEVPGELTKESAVKIKAAFEASHSGLSNAHSLGVLSGGAKYAPITVSPEDAQFLGTQAAKTLDVSMLYGVPPHMLGQVDRTTSWGKGIEEQTLGFIKYTIKSHTDRAEDLWSAMLPEGMLARTDFTELLRPDSAARFAMYQTQRNSAIRTINEIRKDEGWDPVEGGDDIAAPLNSAHSNDPGYMLGEPDAPADDGTAAVPPIAAPVRPSGAGVKSPKARPAGA